MKNNILILGKGFIGRRLQAELNCNISAKKINHFRDALSLIQQYKPDILINCAGHTGVNNVDGCELTPDKTLYANTFLPILLAEATYRNNVKLVHISSGCIYHYNYKKDKPVKETRIPDFYELFYSRSKIYTENILEQLSKIHDVLIARIRVPLDDRPHTKNILTKLIKYKKIIDIPNSVTYIPDFVKALKHLIKINATGIYNIVNKKPLRYPDLMNVYQKHVTDFEYEKINIKDLNLIRTNLVLSTNKLARSGFKMRAQKEILEECVKNYINYS